MKRKDPIISLHFLLVVLMGVLVLPGLVIGASEKKDPLGNQRIIFHRGSSDSETNPISLSPLLEYDCFLSNQRTLNKEQICGCEVFIKEIPKPPGGIWQLQTFYNPEARGVCECKAMCVKKSN